MEASKENEHKLLKLTNDYVFKRIFGSVESIDATSKLLEAITKEKYDSIELDRTPILEQDIKEDKIGILDVRATTNKEEIDIEMQVAYQNQIIDRILWYWAKLYSNTVKKSEMYDVSKRTIIILFAVEEIKEINKINKYHTKWNIREEEYQDIILTDKFEFHIIQIEKLGDLKESDELSCWVKFIKSPEQLEESIMEKYEGIKKANKILKEISKDENERKLAERREEAIIERNTVYHTGFVEGEDKGKQKGKKEEKIEIAKKMLEDKIDISIISKYTGLSEKEIENL